MNLKHPNDPAVAWLLKGFEKELRDGYHFPGSAERVLEQLKRFDDEAETRWQAILKKEAEAKPRAEKASWFMRKYGGKPGEVLLVETRIEDRPAGTPYQSKAEQLVAAKDRLTEAQRILQEVALGETPPQAMLNVTWAIRNILKAKTNISWMLEDV